RYGRSELRSLVEGAGFEAEILTHVFSWLVMPLLVTRRIARGPATGLRHQSGLVDLVALFCTAAERSLIGRLSLPLGSSVLIVACRRDP
ncbi:MAG: hypothetical protein ACR2H3_15945, partial [Acidimicrobiales bacterium]